MCPHSSESTTMRSRNARAKLLTTILLQLGWVCSSFSVHPQDKASVPPRIEIQVCQNKDCCQNFRRTTKGSLVDILEDLLPPLSATTVKITSSGCLSQCERGPNLQIVMTDGQVLDAKLGSDVGTLVHQVGDVTAAAAELQIATSVPIPPKLIAAVNLMEKAQGSSVGWEEKDRLLSSVIRALESDVDLATSSALARARALQAQAYVEAGQYEAALQRTAEVLQGYAAAAAATRWTGKNVEDAPSFVSLACRVSADAQEALEDWDSAMESMQQWALYCPSFRSKVTKELSRLEEKKKCMSR